MEAELLTTFIAGEITPDFCRVFVKLHMSLKPRTTATNLQLRTVVLLGKERSHADKPFNWFDDEAVNHLYESDGALIYREVYRFVRDNQHLFIKD